MRAPNTLGAILAATFAACSTPEEGLAPVDATFSSDQQMQSTPEDFAEFCMVMEGRWIGEQTLATDWPGHGSRGDAITGHAVWTRVVDGNALLGTYFGGQQNNTWLAAYDPGSRQIRSFAVTGAGGVFHGTWFKADGGWALAETGHFADGTEVRSELELTVTDGDETHTFAGTVRVDGELVDPVNDIWRRVSKPDGM